MLRYSVVNFALAGRRNYCNPLTLGVGDEIKGHAGSLPADNCNRTPANHEADRGRRSKSFRDEGDMGVFAAILVELSAPSGSR